MSRNAQRKIRALARALDRGLDHGGVGEHDTDELPEDLRELVGTARAVGRHTALCQPDPSFSARLRSELVAAADETPAGAPLTAELDSLREERERSRAGIPRRWRVARMVLAAALTVAMLGGTAVATTASQAGPGDLLYPVKRWTESARMALASGGLESGRLHLQLASERLEELTASAGSMPAEATRSTLEEMDQATTRGVHDLLAATPQTDDAALRDELDAFLREQRSGLTALSGEVPTGLWPSIQDSVALIDRLRAEAGLPEAGADASLSAQPSPAAASTESDTSASPSPTTGATPEQAGASESSSEPSPEDTSSTDRDLDTVVRDAADGLGETVEQTGDAVDDLLDSAQGGLGGLLGGGQDQQDNADDSEGQGLLGD